MSKIPSTDVIVQKITEFNDGATELTTDDIRQWCKQEAYVFTTINNRLKEFKVGRGKFNLSAATAVQQLEDTFNLPTVDDVPTCVTTEVCEQRSLVPLRDDLFVPFGVFKDVKQVIKSGIHYPLFITGLSGNGKTHAVEQACSQLNREFVRVNVTIETDEDDLIGGFRLVNGETVWSDGPVVEALKRGAVLLLDEVDLASNKIMCLQSILEGNGVYLKKINTYVQPAPGFNVIATANTKGKGSENGMFIGTNVLNEAFLERFAVTLEQEYPSPSTEVKILTRVFASVGCYVEDKLITDLVNWADIIRKTFRDGGIEDVISTRRLLSIVRAYSIWGDITKSMMLCTNRFDDDTKSVFITLWDKVSGDTTENPSEDSEEVLTHTTLGHTTPTF